MKKMGVIYFNLLKYTGDSIGRIALEFNAQTTFNQLFEKIGYPQPILSFSKYNNGNCYNLGYHQLPYIISNGIVEWYPNIDQINVIDFVNTFNFSIENEYLDIYVLYPQAGGPDIYLKIIDLWNIIYPVLDKIGTVFGVWFGFLSFGKWLRYRFKKKVEPNILIDFIISHESWNHFEFAKLLKISPNNAKNLLKGFGYKWNKNTQLYCKTTKTDQLLSNLTDSRDKINQIIKESR